MCPSNRVRPHATKPIGGVVGVAMSFLSNFRFRSSKRKQNANGLYAGSQNSSQSSLARSQMSVPSGLSAGMGTNTTVNTGGASVPQGRVPLFLNPVYVRSSLTKGSFQTIVEVPKYVDSDEWLALNMFEFHSYLLHFYSMLQEFVMADQQCMNGGPGFDYLWIDSNKQAIKLTPHTYIEYTLSWLASKFDDQTLFPTRQGVPFPANFQASARGIYIQLFRIFAYIYHNHFETIVHLSAEPHWNSFFCHFVSVGKTFGMIDRQEAQPLAQLIQLFEQQGKIA